jgi:serine/threonine-protein kinase
VVHRDLKPSNIFLEETRTGEKAVVTDFGLARSYSEGAPLTEAGRAPGTPSYMAPEVLAGEQATPAADIYSFGVVLHEMLFAHRPESASSTEVRLALPAAKLRRIRSIVAKCLDRDPNQRFAHARAAAEALEAAFRYEPLATMSRRRMLIGSSAAALVAAGSFWTEREQVEEWSANLLHPIPRPRHVAVMPANPAVLKPEEASLLGNILETVGSELARAETSERDLFVVLARYLQDQKVQTIPQAVGLFGANLVLTAAVRRAENSTHLTLRVMDAALGKALRSSTVSCAAAALFTLPELAANRAAALLDISRKDWSSRGAQGGTNNGEAYAAYLRGQELLRSDEIPDTEKAIVELQKAVELDAQFALAFAALGEGYAQEYRLTHDPEAAALARRNSQKALDLAPNVAACRRSHAVIEKMQGDYAGEIADLRVAIQLDPRDAQARLLLAQAYAGSGNQERADATFETLLKEHPNYWLALTEWGKIYWRHANYKQAVELFRQASLIAPAAALPLRLLGGAYLKDEQFEKSEQVSQRSIDFLPAGSAYSNLGTAQFWLSEYEKAAVSYQKAVQHSPERYDCWLNLGDCWNQLGRRANAEAAWQEAVDLAKNRLEVNAKDLETTVDLALLDAKLGEAEASKRLLRTANSLGTPDAEALFAEVEAYELAGERDTALRLLQQCAAQGYSRYEILHTPELKELRKDPRFKSLKM